MIALDVENFVRKPRRRKPISGLVVDNFAGGGGASLGLKRALGRDPDIAINHDADAIKMHTANHPRTLHLCESVWQVDPVEVTRGQEVDVAWFSPDCTQFSRAKGATPVKKNIRCLAWVVIRWATRVAPNLILMENVREFQDWGPVIQMKDDMGRPLFDAGGEPVWMPDPDKKGITFKRWVGRLRGLGYVVEWRELNAADYGAPTNRRRLFLIARRDGKRIVWPEPTHGKGRRPYRTAAECIDWSIPCPSIFERKKPLAENTLRRIANGLRKFVIESQKPFIVGLRGPTGSIEPRSVDVPLDTVMPGKTKHLAAVHIAKHYTGVDGHSPDRPLGTITAVDHHSLVSTRLAPYLAGAGGQEGSGRPTGIDKPARACMPHDRRALVTAVIAGVGGRQACTPPKAVNDPLSTITAKNDKAIATAYLARIGQTGSNGDRTSSVEGPLGTVVSKNEDMLITPTLVQTGYGEREGQAPRSLDIEKPLGTVVAGGGKFAIAAPLLVKCNHAYDQFRGQPADAPLQTITSKRGTAVAVANLVQFNENAVGQDGTEPLNTVVTANRHALVTSFLSQYNKQSIGTPADSPTNTQTSQNKAALCSTFLTKMYGTCEHGQSVDTPMPTVTASGNHIAEVRAFLVAYYGSEQDGQAIDEPMRTVVSKARFGLVTIEGVDYQIVDIGMRMLEPRELARAQGFPDDYVLTGSKANQTARIGNSVSPVMSEVLARANAA